MKDAHDPREASSRQARKSPPREPIRLRPGEGVAVSVNVDEQTLILAETFFGGEVAALVRAAVMSGPTRTVRLTLDDLDELIGQLLKQPSAFPLVISARGSYRLKGNITVPDANTTAISITADDVTLDLNGYSTVGSTLCSGVPVTSCTPSGSGNGIISANTNITVINGTVRGVGGDGISLGVRARVERVRAVSNGGRGIASTFESMLADNTAATNGSVGITTGGTSRVGGNIVEGNSNDGVQAGSGSVVSGNTVRSNGGFDISTNEAIVTGNIAKSNGGPGVSAGFRSVLTGNAASNNASDGIQVGAYCALIGNAAAVNSGFGITSSSLMTGYTENVLSDNISGSVVGGTDMGHNLCDGSTTCP